MIDGWMEARTMPCILHSTCMSYARTVHPQLQDGWTDGCKNHAMHLTLYMYVTCKDSPPSVARWMDGWIQEPCHASCILHVPYCLAVTPCSLLRPPPYFQAKLLYRVFHLHYTPPPPRAARAGLRYCSSCTCTCVASVFVYQACRK